MLKNHPALSLLLTGGVLCNDAVLEWEGEEAQIVGDPTEGAIVMAGARMGLPKRELEKTFPRAAEVPFDSDRKRMTTVHRFPQTAELIPDKFKGVWKWEGWIGRFPYVVFTKGAVDSLLEITNQIWCDDHAEDMNGEWLERIQEANEKLAKQGVRVLGVACQSLEQLPEEIERIPVRKRAESLSV